MSSVLTPQQRRVPAAGAPTPQTTAPTSVFTAGQAAKSKRAYEPFDPDTVEIEEGVPLPPAATARAHGSLALLNRMKPGSRVKVPHRKALTLASAAKKAGIKVALRRLDDGLTGVWKL